MSNKVATAGIIGTATIGILTMAAFAVAYFAFAQGFMLAKLWEWHAVPRGLPAMSWAQWATIALGIRTLWPAASVNCGEKKPEKSETLGKLGGLIIAPWLGLLLGWWLAP